MTTIFTQSLCAALLAVAMLTSCSRPVAYFQRGPVNPSSKSSAQIMTLTTPAQHLAKPAQSLMQVSTIADQPEAYVRKDSRLSIPKSSSNRIARIREILTSTTGTVSSKAINAPHKITGIERLLLNKMNKQISKQLAPNHPEKALINKGKLVGSLVLLIAGLLMLILGTGTLAFIGLIVGLVGALGLIVSLLGIDS